MTVSKRILIVFPHNFYEQKSGVQKRYFEFIIYLKEKGFSIDLLGLKHFESSWKKFDHENSKKLIDRLYLYDFRIGYNRQRVKLLFSKKSRFHHNELPDYAFPGMISLFNKLTVKNRYDFVIISYVYWANLLKEPTDNKFETVLTIEDFISQKIFENRLDKRGIEDSMKEEIERVNLFDKAICLSYEEIQFFSSHALNPAYFFIPVFMEKPIMFRNEKEYDVLFIGYDNEDNKEGLEWFFKYVYPLLKSGVKIIVVGGVARYAPNLDNVKRVEYISDLGEVYSKSRISINPLQGGTGMKVKVVESLAYEVPVVSTSKGLCGMPPEIIHDFIVADDPLKFANEISHLLSDEAWYLEQCNKVNKIFMNYFEAGMAKKELDKIFSL